MSSDANSGLAKLLPPGAAPCPAFFSDETPTPGVSVQFGGKAFAMDAQERLTVAGHYGALTVDSSGGYSYCLDEGVGAQGNAYVQIGDEACVYIVEPPWSATEVFLISDGHPQRGLETHQVVVSIAMH